MNTAYKVVSNLIKNAKTFLHNVRILFYVYIKDWRAILILFEWKQNKKVFYLHICYVIPLYIHLCQFAMKLAKEILRRTTIETST